MYKLVVLSSKDFDQLPDEITRGSNISMSLGFANPFRKEAYVRHTAWPELNRYLLDHELEHLIEEHKTDEDENGICHKGVMDVFQHLVNPLNFGGYGPLSNENKGFLDTSKGGAFNSVAGPLSNAVGGAAKGFAFGGPVGAAGGAINGLTSYDTQKPGNFQGDSFSNLFGQGNIPQISQSSMGQGFGQTGSFSPSGMGQGGQSAPMANMGLGAGIPNQANISMGQGSNPEQKQNQSGYYYPSFKF